MLSPAHQYCQLVIPFHLVPSKETTFVFDCVWVLDVIPTPTLQN